MAFDGAGNLFISELDGCVHKLDTSGKLTIYAGGGLSVPGDGGPATSAAFNRPGDVAVDNFGNLYIADSDYGRVHKISAPPAAPPVITTVVNAFGGGATIAPNMWVAVQGTNLSPPSDMRIWGAADFPANQLPTQMDGVGATVNGKKAFVYYISPTQLNILTPPDALSGAVQVQVTINGAVSNSMTVQTAALAPSYFVYDGVHVVALHLDGSRIGPTSLYPGLTTPAAAGEEVVLYANGFGATSSPVVSGSITQSGTLPAFPTVTIGGLTAEVLFAG
jgi:uncharacterized protein (TIGR03437 family)